MATETGSCANGDRRSAITLILTVVVKCALLFETCRSVRPLRHPPLWELQVYVGTVRSIIPLASRAMHNEDRVQPLPAT